jgi:hypothetical protein
VITGTKIINPKTVLGSSLGEDVGFRDNNNNNNNNFFYDDSTICVECYGKLSGNKY